MAVMRVVGEGWERAKPPVRPWWTRWS